MSRHSIAPVDLRRIEFTAFAEVSAGLDLLVCQTPQWMDFLKASQQAEPVLARVLADGLPVGIFVGAIVRRAGLRILGSPLRGWTTSYMGFALHPNIEPGMCLAALRKFAFNELRCAHLELLDQGIRAVDYAAPWQSKLLHGYEIDLTRSEEELFTVMTPACRRCIRKAEKCGVAIETVVDPTGFAAEFHGQLTQVFAKQGLAPSYSGRRVEQLIDALHPSGMLLLLRARDADGRSIATSVFPGHGDQMYFWGGASRQDSLLMRPNEAMVWHALRWWRARGATRCDMGGGGNYKAKYGGRPIAVPWARCSRNQLISGLRRSAERALRLKQRLMGQVPKVILR